MSPLDRIDWLASIAGDRSLPPSALAVAVVVAKFTNAKTGDARPSKETIARMVGTDERAVRRMVRALEDGGWMKAVHTNGRMCCNYQPVNPGTTTRVEPGHSNPGKNNPGTATRVPAVPQPGQGDAANPGTVTPQTRVEQVSEQENIPESVFLDDGDGRQGPDPGDEPPSDLEPIAPEWMDQGQPATPAPDPEQTRKQKTPEEIQAEKDRDEKFERWFDKYGKRVGKKPAKKKWDKLRAEDQDKCLSVVDAYVKSRPDVQFRKDPTTYLNQECFNDEIQKNSGGKSSQSSEWGNMPLDSNGYPDVFRMWKEGIKLEGMEADWK